MALANIYAGPEVAGTAFETMNPVKVGALHAMTRVPGLMDTVAQRRATQPFNPWDPNEAMAVLNPRGYVRYDPSLGSASSLGTLRGSVHHGADFSPQVQSWYGNEDAAYQELMRDLSLAEQSGQIGYHRDIDTSRGKDIVNYTQHYGTADLPRQQTMDALARALASYGVQDLADVGVGYDAEGNPLFYDQRTGRGLPEDLFSVQSKKNVANYSLGVDEAGNIIPVFDSTFTATRAKRLKRNAGLMGVAGLAAAPFLPGIGAALGSSLGIGATAGTALAGAGLGALGAGVSGGDPLKGAVLGGVGAGLGSALPNTELIRGISNAMLRPAATGAIVGGATGALGSAMYGGDLLKGGLTGALTGGVGGLAVGAFGNTPTPGQQLSPLQQMQNAALGYAGRTAGGQLASNLIGSPYNRPATPQPQNTAPVAAPQPAVPTWLPQHVQQSILGMQGAANG